MIKKFVPRYNCTLGHCTSKDCTSGTLYLPHKSLSTLTFSFDIFNNIVYMHTSLKIYIETWLVPSRFSWRHVKARVGWRECEQWGSDWQIGNPKWRPLQWRTQTLTMPIGTIFPGHCTRLLLCKWPFSFKFVTCVYNFIWYLILYTGLAGNMSLVT